MPPLRRRRSRPTLRWTTHDGATRPTRRDNQTVGRREPEARLGGPVAVLCRMYPSCRQTPPPPSLKSRSDGACGKPADTHRPSQRRRDDIKTVSTPSVSVSAIKPKPRSVGGTSDHARSSCHSLTQVFTSDFRLNLVV